MSHIVKCGFIFIVLFLTFSINLPDSVVAHLGFDSDILIATLFAVIFTWLLAHRGALLIVLVTLICLAANLGQYFDAIAPMDQNVLIASLITLALLPMIKSWMD